MLLLRTNDEEISLELTDCHWMSSIPYERDLAALAVPRLCWPIRHSAMPGGGSVRHVQVRFSPW